MTLSTRPLTVELLSHEYLERGRSIRQIAAQLAIPSSSVVRAMREFGVPSRPSKQARGRQLKDILTPEFLTRRYITERRSIRQIAQEVGCGYSIVQRALAHHNIEPPATTSGSSALTEDVLRRRYMTERQSVAAIAHALNCDGRSVRRALHRYGIPTRPRGRPRSSRTREV